MMETSLPAKATARHIPAQTAHHVLHAAFFTQLFHHLLHPAELFQQAVDILYLRARTGGESFLPGTVDNGGKSPFSGSHGV